MSIIKRIGPWVLLAALAGAPAYALKLMGAFSGLALYADTQIEEPPANNNARTLPERQPGDTVRFQLFAPAAGGGTTNGYTVELDLPGRTFSDDVGSVSGMDWRGNALTSGGPATVSALILPAATVPATGYLGRIDLTLTGALTTGAVLAVKSLVMTSGDDVDSLDVSSARISFAGAGNAGDFNYDGSVNLADLLAFADMFGKASSEAGYDARGDFDNSGRIDLSDFLAFADVFGKTYPIGGNGGGRGEGGDDLAAGTIRRLTDNDADDCAPAWSPDGRQIAFHSNRDGSYSIYVMDADGSSQRNLTDNDADDYAPDWSPDGRQIAFQSTRGRLRRNIYVMDADGSNQRNLTPDAFNDWFPAWSPDGRQIAFQSGLTGEIYVMDADGGNPTNLTHNDASDAFPDWSPDGQQIAFVSDRDGNSEIWVMDADGGNPRKLTHSPYPNLLLPVESRHISWSPDGRRIALTFEPDRSKEEIYVMDADGGNRRNLTRNDADDLAPAWSPDGRQIAFCSYRDGNWEVYVMELRVGVTDDHGNNRLVATSLFMGSSRSGRIETGGDVDYFSVEVTAPGTLTVYTTGGANTYGTLHDEWGFSALERNDDGGGGENFRIERKVSAGTYYVEVKGHDTETTGSYTIHARFASDSDSGGGGGSGGGSNLGACRVGLVVRPNQSCTVSGGAFRNVGGGCFNYTPFGSGRFCTSSFNLNGLRGTRSGSDFQITAVP